MSWPNVVLHRRDAEELLAAGHNLLTIAKFRDMPDAQDMIRRCDHALAMARAKMEDRGDGDLLRYATDLMHESTLQELHGLDRYETSELVRLCRCWSERAEARLMDRSLR